MNSYSEIFGYNKDEARKYGLAYAIKEIEKLLGTLDVDITESQGAMIDLYARLEEEEIYQEILKFLDPNYNLDMQKLNKEAFDRYYKEDKAKKFENEIYLKAYLERHNLPYIEEN